MEIVSISKPARRTIGGIFFAATVAMVLSGIGHPLAPYGEAIVAVMSVGAAACAIAVVLQVRCSRQLALVCSGLTFLVLMAHQSYGLVVCIFWAHVISGWVATLWTEDEAADDATVEAEGRVELDEPAAATEQVSDKAA